MSTNTDFLRGAKPGRCGLLHGISIAHDTVDMGTGRSRQIDVRPLCVSINIVAHDRQSKLLLRRLSEQLKQLVRDHGGTVQAIEKVVEAVSKQEAKT